MSLHLDYRLNELDQMIGNEVVIKTIKSLLNRERKDIPHVWLFIGPGGTGKTTLARIVSKLLGCEPLTTNQDFQEINASSRGGIDTAREVESTMGYMPMSKNSKARVYLFEEVQRSSADFREAMLNKCLEFTPPHAYFIFCTTNPEKLGRPDGPFRRRCHTFEMKKLDHNRIVELVNHVLEEEGEDGVDEDVINAIAKTANGCPGQALILLDRIIDLNPDEMLVAVQGSEESQKQTIDLCRALLNGTWKNAQEVLKDLKEDPEKVRQAVNYYMQAVLLRKPRIDDRALLVMECFESPNFYNGKPGLVKACADVFS